MWRSKKFIIVALLTTVVLAGSIGGVALAQTENGDDCQPEARHSTLLERVCEIYEENTGEAINPQELQEAFAQAQSEMRDTALNNRLQHMVGQGRITQNEADQYGGWWNSRPDVPARFGFPGTMGRPHRFSEPCAPAE